MASRTRVVLDDETSSVVRPTPRAAWPGLQFVSASLSGPSSACLSRRASRPRRRLHWRHPDGQEHRGTSESPSLHRLGSQARGYVCGRRKRNEWSRLAATGQMQYVKKTSSTCRRRARAPKIFQVDGRALLLLKPRCTRTDSRNSIAGYRVESLSPRGPPSSPLARLRGSPDRSEGRSC